MNFHNYIFTVSCICYHLVTANKEEVGGWENVYNNKFQSKIPLEYFGEKVYYFGDKFKVNFLEAEQICKHINMELATFESFDELSTVYNYLVGTSPVQDYYWTSGSNLVDNINDNWISAEQLNTNFFVKPPGEMWSVISCNVLNIKAPLKLAMNKMNCELKSNYICQRDIHEFDEISAAYYSRIESTDKIPLYSQLTVPHENMEFLQWKNKTFFFETHLKATYLQAIQICQMINMQLVSIDSEEESNIINDYILSNTQTGATFWTSGTNLIDGENWIWLLNAKNVKLSSKLSRDTIGECYRNCIFIKLTEEEVRWENYYCNTKQFYICERGHNEVKNIEIKQRDAIPIIQHVVVTTSPPRTESNIDYEIIKTEVKGPQRNLRRYLPGKTTANKLDAENYCNRDTLKLATIENEKENELITKAIQLYERGGATSHYWLSAKLLPDGKWMWNDNIPMAYTHWAPGFPNFEKDHCVFIDKNGSWKTAPCVQPMYFVCEIS